MAPGLHNRSGSRLLSTGDVARLLSVTSDTVLKWIKSGRLPALRTAGGHYRVAERDLDGLTRDPLGSDSSQEVRGFAYCWEYYGSGGEANAVCLDCLVYRARARRCYEMSSLAPELGFAGAHCQTSCEECAYYQEVVRRARRVLIVTESEELRQRLRSDSAGSRLELEFASSEYECSAVCAEFKPEYVVIDGALSREARASLCSHLANDPRIPGVQIILAVTGERPSAAETESSVDRALPRTFRLAELEDHILGLEVTPRITA